METSQLLETRQELKMFLRMEQANLLELEEDEFQHLIGEIERTPLFRRLRQEEKLIRYQRPPRADLSSSFCEVKEELLPERGSLDVDSLLQNKDDLLAIIRRLGVDNFKRYFLYGEPDMTLPEIAHQCHIDLSEVKRINSLIDEVAVLSEFYHPSALGSDDKICYYKIAAIERRPEGFVIAYFSPSHARGKYVIDYERFETLKDSGAFAKGEIKEIKQLFHKMELINSRKDTLYRILECIVDKQKVYLDSGEPRALLPFSQKELARRVGLAPSSVSRAISNKSIETPLGEGKPLKDFFPRSRRFRMEAVRELLHSDKGILSDEKARGQLMERFGISLSRRSIASLRRELRIPPAWRRKALP